MRDTYDVIVVGGGPAGATASGLLSKRGRRVLLLEKEKFPRYHIGESLIPGVMPIIQELGAVQVLADLGAIPKRGVTLVWGQSPEPWTIRFDELAPDYPRGESDPQPYAYQVKRAEFDNMLLTHSRRLGTTIVEEAQVRKAIFDGDRCTGVLYSASHPDELVEVHAPMVLDASGQAKFMARHRETVTWHDDLKNLAAWTYFQGGSRFDGDNAGNILVEACPPGWLWMIPFSDDTCSVGYVAPSAVFAASDLSPEQLLHQQLSRTGVMSTMLDGTTKVAQVRTAKDWSYNSTEMGGPGFLQAGDAAAFIDPLFSTGVMLAMKGGSLAAHAIDRILGDPGSEAQVCKVYEKEYRAVLDVVLSFVRVFYDQNQEVEEYFEQARELIDPEKVRKAREDFITLISGLAKAVEGWQIG
jgi:flavin-dependent dehydrogenase